MAKMSQNNNSNYYNSNIITIIKLIIKIVINIIIIYS